MVVYRQTRISAADDARPSAARPVWIKARILLMDLFSKSQFLTLWIVIGVVFTLAGCSSLLEELEQVPAPDIAKAISAIKNVAGQYHLAGELQIAGPVKAPAVSLDPWVICL
jgi:hypothetical protein